KFVVPLKTATTECDPAPNEIGLSTASPEATGTVGPVAPSSRNVTDPDPGFWPEPVAPVPNTWAVTVNAWPATRFCGSASTEVPLENGVTIWVVVPWLLA